MGSGTRLSRLCFKLKGKKGSSPNPSLKAQILARWDLGLETGIWASKLGFEGGRDEGGVGEIVPKALDGQQYPCPALGGCA